MWSLGEDPGAERPVDQDLRERRDEKLVEGCRHGAGSITEKRKETGSGQFKQVKIRCIWDQRRSKTGVTSICSYSQSHSHKRSLPVVPSLQSGFSQLTCPPLAPTLPSPWLPFWDSSFNSFRLLMIFGVGELITSLLPEITPDWKVSSSSYIAWIKHSSCCALFALGEKELRQA